MFTTKAIRIALTAAALCAAATSAAIAKPRSLVVMGFDGTPALAESGRSAVVKVLGEEYSLVSQKQWDEARASVKDSHGPAGWRKAAKRAGVDVIVEGWIEGKELVVTVRDATTGEKIDDINVKVGKKGVSEAGLGQLRTRFDEVLDDVVSLTDAKPSLPTVTAGQARDISGSKSRLQGDDSLEDEQERPRSRTRDRDRDRDTRTSRDDRDDRDRDTRTSRDDRDTRTSRDDRDLDRDRDRDRDDRSSEDSDVTERRAKPPVVGLDTKGNVEVFGPKSEEISILEPKAVHVPKKSPMFEFYGGLYYGSRSLLPDAEGVTQDYGARSKGLQLHAAAFPFPRKKMDAGLNGIGFTFNLYHSAGSEVGLDDEETVGNYPLNQNGFEGAIHYRQPLGLVSIDGEVGYGQHNYILASDIPDTIEVPDVQYKAFHAGAHLDLHVTERASIGFGAKMFYVLDNGDLSGLDWYGPGSASGFNIDANFVIPLPKQLFVRGDLSYRRFTTTLDGAGIITEEENVFSVSDATMNGSVNLGIHF